MLYDKMMDPAFPGMKADSGDDRVESFPVGAATLAFGVIAGTDAGGLLVAGPGTKVRGPTLQSHCHINGYLKGDSASIMRRGLSWVTVTAGDAVTNDGPVKYAADGTVGDAGANTLPNAAFRSGKVTRGDGSIIALVEMASPVALTPAA